MEQADSPLHLTVNNHFKTESVIHRGPEIIDKYNYSSHFTQQLHFARYD